MDEEDKKFEELLRYFAEHPEERPEEFEKFVRGILLDPVFHQSLVERLKRDELAPAILDDLLARARDPRPTEGRRFARRVLSEAWKEEDAIH